MDGLFDLNGLAAASQSSRHRFLESKFESISHHLPQFFTRAPGRVNIIGEHIDYCGFSVLPAAIEPDLIIAGSLRYHHHQLPSNLIDQTDDTITTTTTVQLDNLQSNIYPSRTFSLDYPPKTSISFIESDWSTYVKASLKTVIDHVQQASNLSSHSRLPETIKLLYDSTLPAASGLSSSAAITTASVLTFLYAYISPSQHHQITKSLVTDLAISSERATGINVGGMDQTASVFGERAKLLHIQFTPTKQVVPLSFPINPPTTFVIANTLLKSNKLASASTQYNLRVVETKIGTRLLAQAYSIDHTSIKSLSELVDQINEDIDLNAFDVFGDEGGLSLEEVLNRLKIDQAGFEREILDGIDAKPKQGRYMIYTRLRHVLSESKRVKSFCQLLEEGDKIPGEELIKATGKLMNNSHNSCRDDYDCSCPELDLLVNLGRQHGSLGSRLTGAGWGGSTVHLVRDENLEKFINALRSEYYLPRFPDLSNDDLHQACFASKPGLGARIWENVMERVP